MSVAERTTSPLAHGLRQLAIGAVLLALFVASSIGSRASLDAMLDGRALGQALALLGGLLRPDLDAAFVARVAWLTAESLAIGAIGMAVALVLAIPLAVCAARVPGLRDTPSRAGVALVARGTLRWGARSVLSALRSIPEIIWAYLFVRILGLGAGPAVLAIGLSFAGIIGKLYAELIDACDPRPLRALEAAGASRMSILLHGVLPQVRQQWTGYGLFRFECAIRSAAIVGIVGAGGLGSEIELSIRYFQYDKLSTALLALLACVVVMELASMRLRKSATRWSLGLVVSGTLAGAVFLDVDWAALPTREALAQSARFIQGFLPPTTSQAMLRRAATLMMETVAMAAFATAVAALLALSVAPFASRMLTIRGFLPHAPRGSGALSRAASMALLVVARGWLQLLRAVPEVVWALLFVVWVGPGPFAGALAIMAHTIGILGRLFGEVYEDCEAEAPRVLEATGCSRWSNWIHGVLPQTAPQLAAFTLFRFEVNVRATAMVGFVGAGGIGDAIHTAISLFHMADLAALLLVMWIVVVLIDIGGDHLRMRMLQA